ncbi:MAG: efflux RND transporter periplasmic adaptor subunit [bacterium]
MNRACAVACVTAAAISAACAAGCSGKKSANERGAGAGEKKYVVRTVAAERGAIVEYLEVTGTAEAETAVNVSAKLPGRIEKLFFDKGDPVKKGQLLFTLDTKELSAQKNQAEAAISAGEVTKENIRKNLGRMEELFSKGVGTQKAVDDLTAAYRVAEEQVRQGEANLRLVNTQIENSRVTAPISGEIAMKNFEEGEMVMPGMPVFQLLDTSSVKIAVPMPEADITKVRMGGAAKVVVDAYSGTEFDGEVGYISPALNPMDRQFSVEVRVPNPERALKAGMFARVRIATRSAEDVVVVPERAVIERMGRRTVFVVEDGRAADREVKTGIESGDMVEIVEGLAAGERVVVEGNYQLQPGMSVEEIRE